MQRGSNESPISDADSRKPAQPRSHWPRFYRTVPPCIGPAASAIHRVAEKGHSRKLGFRQKIFSETRLHTPAYTYRYRGVGNQACSAGFREELFPEAWWLEANTPSLNHRPFVLVHPYTLGALGMRNLTYSPPAFLIA